MKATTKKAVAGAKLKKGQPVKVKKGVATPADEKFRSAKTGRFVTKKFAGSHKATTVKEGKKNAKK